MIKWKTYWPIALLTTAIVFYFFFGINFFHNLYDFSIGNPYDETGIYLAIFWFTGLVWTGLNRKQPDHLRATGQGGGLYQITGLREKQLLHVSALSYNEGSKRVINRFQPDKNNEPDLSKKPQALSKQEPIATSITGKFQNDGAKKEEPQTNSTPNDAGSTGVSQSTKAVESGPLATINTALKGVSQFDEEKAKKLRASLKNFGPKRKETTQS
ncbi:hypothetical protein [Spirosoma migulaei]